MYFYLNTNIYFLQQLLIIVKVKLFFLLISSLVGYKAFSQLNIQAKIHYQPHTYFPEQDKTYKYGLENEYGVIDRMVMEGSIGYKFINVGFRRYTQGYNLEGYTSLNRYELAEYPYFDRSIYYTDFILGFSYEINRLNFNLNLIYSKFEDRRLGLILIPPSYNPHHWLTSNKGNGKGLGISISYNFFENLSIGVDGNYMYYSDLEEKRIYRYSPFLSYKYTFQWVR